jgi:hypothetical protein
VPRKTICNQCAEKWKRLGIPSLRAGRPYFNSWQRRDCSLSRRDWTASGAHHASIQWVPRVLSLGVKHLEQEARNSFPFSADVNECSFTPPPPPTHTLYPVSVTCLVLATPLSLNSDVLLPEVQCPLSYFL